MYRNLKEILAIIKLSALVKLVTLLPLLNADGVAVALTAGAFNGYIYRQLENRGKTMCFNMVTVLLS